MKNKISIIDDDKNLTGLLSNYLENEGYSVVISDDGVEGLQSLRNDQPDIIILDVSMPNKDGWKTLKKIRELNTTPVIMLTARSEEKDILLGFSLGADDYITKPFSFSELIARVKAVLSRAGSSQKNDDGKMLVGDFLIDFHSSKVYRNEELISLTPTEFKLFIVLVQNMGRPVSSRDLFRQIWGPHYAGEIGYVRRYIWHLRQKLEIDPKNPQYIQNDHSFGYRFSLPAGSG